jgi:hypothetical protein
VSLPFGVERVTRTGSVPASLSETVTALEFAAEKTSGVFWLVACAPGTVLTGASFTALIVSETVAGADSALPLSATLKVKLSGPL